MVFKVLALSLLIIGLTQTQPDDLALELQPTSTPNVFQVSLHNQSPKDLTLNLGYTIANGKEDHPDAIRYTLTTSSGQVLHLFRPAFVEGSLGFLIVPLPAEKTYTFSIDLNDYRAPEAGTKLDLSGHFTLQAQYRGTPPSKLMSFPNSGLEHLSVWTGVISSKPLTR